MDFLQSRTWRQIQTIVGRDIVDVAIDDCSYRGIRRSRSLGPVKISWLQFLGIEMMDQAQKIVQSVWLTRSWGDVFVQVGAVGVIGSHDAKKRDSYDELARLRSESDVIWSDGGFCPSRKENMPLATVVTPIGDADALMALMHKDHRRSLRKAQKESWTMISWDGSYDDAFYDVWSQMWQAKWVGIMARESYDGILRYLREEWVGDLYVLVDGEDRILAGSIMAYHDDGMVYLYGWLNRSIDTVWWAHVLLQYLIMCEWYEKWYKRFDHRGVAPWCDPTHRLAGVSRFKQRFGGVQKEFVGNMDRVWNPLLYKFMKWRSWE